MAMLNPSFDFSKYSDEEIASVLKQENIRLSADEAKKIQALLKRSPTLAECILWSIQGSEHCSYKSTRIHLKTLPTDAPNVILGPKEDAGVVEVARDHVGHRYGIVMSHESHNHPSQIVPYEGAATGVGGNVRDVSCMGAEVIAVADTLRFGDIHHPKTHLTDQGVVAGIAGYANPIGVPNLTGDVYYDSAYQHNCLVTVISLGVVRDDHLIHSYAPENAVGYDLILVGKPTDNSGFGGASFASFDLDENQTEQNKGAVQEPNAFLGRHLLKTNTALFKKLAAKNLISRVGFKDLGAGGVACASVEIADGAGYGAEIDLECVHVSMQNLSPAVILCAETQERYLWTVPPELTPMILQHYNEEWQLPRVSRGAKASVIGKIRDDGQYIVKYKGETLVSAKASDITQGIVYDRPYHSKTKTSEKIIKSDELNKTTLLSLLTDPNLASRKPIYECYDKQVQGRTVIERGEAAAGVMAPFNSEDYPAEIRNKGIALAVAHNPAYGKVDAFKTAYHAVISSIRKVCSVGAKPAALTDCLCFGNPEKPEQMGEIVDAIAGLKAACESIPLYDHRDYPTPIIGGNVSLYNESEQGAIPASPIVSCLGVLDKVQLAITPAFKQPHSTLICLMKNKNIAEECFAVLDLIQESRLLSCSVLDMGGLAYALMTATFKHDVGFELTTDLPLLDDEDGFLFEVKQDQLQSVTEILTQRKLSFYAIGQTKLNSLMQFGKVSLDIAEAKTIFYRRLRELRS